MSDMFDRSHPAGQTRDSLEGQPRDSVAGQPRDSSPGQQRDSIAGQPPGPFGRGPARRRLAGLPRIRLVPALTVIVLAFTALYMVGLVLIWGGQAHAILQARPCPHSAPAAASGCIQSTAAVITNTDVDHSRETSASANYRTADGQTGELDGGSAFAQIARWPDGTRVDLLSYDGQITAVRLPDGAVVSPDSSPVVSLRDGLEVLMVVGGIGMLCGVMLVSFRCIVWNEEESLGMVESAPVRGVLLAVFPAALTYYLDPGNYIPGLVVLVCVGAIGMVVPEIVHRHREQAVHE